MSCMGACGYWVEYAVTGWSLWLLGGACSYWVEPVVTGWSLCMVTGHIVTGSVVTRLYWVGGTCRYSVESEMQNYVLFCSKFDLYSKADTVPDVKKLKPYYQKLIDKYIPGELSW